MKLTMKEGAKHLGKVEVIGKVFLGGLTERGDNELGRTIFATIQFLAKHGSSRPMFLGSQLLETIERPDHSITFAIPASEVAHGL